MIYWPILHRLARGHAFVPHMTGYDKYGEYFDGCEVCLIQAPVIYYGDRHRAGICPKTLAGYTCHGMINECGK